MRNEPLARRQGARNVVVLDDDPFMLKLLGRILATLGLNRITTCSSGAQALGVISDHDAGIDVVLLDINMPEMDGIEFIRQLVSINYSGDVILVSGEGNRMLESMQRLVRSHGLRMLGALHKPPSTEQLRELLCRDDLIHAEECADGRRRRAPTLAELSVAIDSGHIVNHYQPQVLLESDQGIGAECLVRWQREDGSIILPDQFIPMAEEFNLISRITREVLRSAANQIRAWRQIGLEVPLSVNISMQDICALDFPDVISDIVASAGVEPRLITLEVTESRVLQHLSTVLDVIGRLRLKRFHLSIDDFGTGHSSLAQLRDLPFDELKIDRGFVNGASSNATQRAICSATLRMAAQLGMSVVAEGIEERCDQQMLIDMGCKVGQGYLFARPMTSAALTPWLRTHFADRHSNPARG
jgi:EAL domain-containing protein (putative c-di-GMP-specific phosphodiesterase class I)/FixJ family two-component response regulator